MNQNQQQQHRANSIPNSSKYLKGGNTMNQNHQQQKHLGKPIPNSSKYLKGGNTMNQNQQFQNQQQKHQYQAANLGALEEELLTFGSDPKYVGYIYPDYDDYE